MALFENYEARIAQINAALNGRGGGRPTMIQGSCTASRKEIEAFFDRFE